MATDLLNKPGTNYVVEANRKSKNKKSFDKASSTTSWEEVGQSSPPTVLHDLESYLTEQERMEILAVIQNRKKSGGDQPGVTRGIHLHKKWLIKTNDESFHQKFRADTSRSAYYPWKLIQVHFKQTVTSFADDNPGDLDTGQHDADITPGASSSNPSAMAPGTAVNEYEPDLKRLKTNQPDINEVLTSSRIKELDWITTLEQEAEQESKLDLYSAAALCGDDSLMARAIRDEAAALAVLTDYDESVRRLQEATSLASKAGNLALQAAIQRFAADVHINQGSFKEALSAAREAVELSERQGD
ncbi:unnamed protein product, partial [Effrenium voratum]